MHVYHSLRHILLAFIFVFSSAVWGASFIYTPFDKQLRDADAAVYGVVKDSTIKKNPQGQVVTRFSIELSWAAGLKRDDDVHPKSFHVTVPGGSWQGVNYQVSGAPNFKKNEEVFLLLKNSQFGHVVFNLSLGKYQVYRRKQNTFLKSIVFPDHAELGQLNLEKVKKMAQENFRTVKYYKKERKPVHHSLKKIEKKNKTSSSGRAIASVDDAGEKKDSSSGLFWPFILLACIATAQKVLRVRSK